MQAKLSPRVRFLNASQSFVIWRPDVALGIVTDQAGVEIAQSCDGIQHLPDTPQVTEFLNILEYLGLINSPEISIQPKSAKYQCKRVFINLTNACNFRCRYCHAESGPKQKGELNFEEWVAVVTQLPQLEPKGVTFTGGEVLIRQDTLAIVQELRKQCCNIPVTLNTNGSLITKEIAPKLAFTFDRIKVSLDALPDINDAIRGDSAYQRAMHGIELLLDARANVEINITLTRPALPRLDEFVESLHSLGIRAFKFNPLLLIGSSVSTLDLKYTTQEVIDVINRGGRAGKMLRAGLLEGIAQRFGTVEPAACGVGNYMTISSNGDVYPCHTLKFADFKLANIRESSLLDIWHNSPIFTQLRSMNVSQYRKCETCDYRQLCQGGCRGLAYQNSNLLDAPPDCEERLAVYEYFLPCLLPKVFLN